MTKDTDFVDRLIKARSALGWSQAELSQVSGISATQISRYESGISSPRPQAVGRLAKSLNVSFDWLSHGKGSIDPDLSERSGLAPDGWKSVELELPLSTIEWLQVSGAKQGVSSEARLLQILQEAIKEELKKSPDTLGGLILRMAELEKKQKELADRVRPSGSKIPSSDPG